MARLLLIGTWCLLAAATSSAAQEKDVLQSFKQTVAAAEEGLRLGELEIAESRYRTALLQGWLILGELHVSAGRLPEARRAFERASSSAVDDQAAAQALALVQLQMGESEPALGILTRITMRSPQNAPLRVTLAQALAAAGRPEEAVQELEQAHALAPNDPQLTFALASGYLRVKNLAAAEKLFAKVAAARPVPYTHVLIGRTYRDFRFFDQARAALRRALKIDPKTPRAHYYLGTAAVMEEGINRVEEAIAEFKEELKINPADVTTTLRLGMALVEMRREAEALPLLQRAIDVSDELPDAWLYLGRSQLAVGRPSDAIVSLRQALKVGQQVSERRGAIDQARLRSIQYQLGTALRQIGDVKEAERAFAEAEQLAATRAATAREELAQYLADTPETGISAPALTLEVSEFEKLSDTERAQIAANVRAALARAYLNLGIVHAQAKHFTRAVDLFEQAAGVDPDFPQLQYSLGVAYFNAKRFDKAAAALTRALEQQPANVDVRRMLALAAFNAEDYAKAVELLRNDPKRSVDPSLQYAYGIALVQSQRADEAELIFTRILNEHPDVPEVNVVLGQAYAARGDYEGAITALQRAIQLNPAVAEANTSLGLIYLQQGRLGAARDALSAGLKSHPTDTKARYTLATVLDLEGKSDEAVSELRTILSVHPAHANARYLLGKVLLARGAAAEAVEQLEIAVKLAADDANIHYQLGQAYQRLGRAELAAQEFEKYRKLKDRQRGGTP